MAGTGADPGFEKGVHHRLGEKSPRDKTSERSLGDFHPEAMQFYNDGMGCVRGVCPNPKNPLDPPLC